MIRIGVIGQSGEIPAETGELAEEIGKEIALRGAILLTGGTSGVMGAVSRGAKQANGLVVGILPGDSVDVANEYIDIPISTGLSFDYRSLILVHSSDVIIMIAGGNGTLGELSAAYLNRKPVVIVEPSGDGLQEFEAWPTTVPILMSESGSNWTTPIRLKKHLLWQ